ncbi:hypothetical protein C8Q74DRAFT_381994 [Fomes fomentarius]|nr:hypothetical protein C8Q74DRAFT_381994 [Fomes fomentarius]
MSAHRGTRYKEKFQALREKYDQVTATHVEYEHALARADEKLKRLQEECNLLLDAVDIAVPAQPTLLHYLARDPIPPNTTRTLSPSLPQAQKAAVPLRPSTSPAQPRASCRPHLPISHPTLPALAPALVSFPLTLALAFSFPCASPHPHPHPHPHPISHAHSLTPPHPHALSRAHTHAHPHTHPPPHLINHSLQAQAHEPPPPPHLQSIHAFSVEQLVTPQDPPPTPPSTGRVPLPPRRRRTGTRTGKTGGRRL